jgi:hypothetical protein
MQKLKTLSDSIAMLAIFARGLLSLGSDPPPAEVSSGQARSIGNRSLDRIAGKVLHEFQ